MRVRPIRARPGGNRAIGLRLRLAGQLGRLRTRAGRSPILWAGPSVTTTLPFGSVADVERDVERIIDTLAGQCPLFILPANNILPDCPVENITALYGHATRYGVAYRSRGPDGGSS